MSVLAGNVLTDELFKTYFCDQQPGCGESSQRGLYRSSQRYWLVRAGRWGGGRNEFAKRAALEAFVANDLQPLFTWSKTLSRDVALVGWTLMPEYDFEKPGKNFRPVYELTSPTIVFYKNLGLTE